VGRLRAADLRPHLLRQQRAHQEEPKLIERFLRATHKGWKDAKASPAASIDAMAEAVPGLDRNTLLATMPQILDLCVTERSAKHGLGWIEPELMQKTADITLPRTSRRSRLRWRMRLRISSVAGSSLEGVRMGTA